MTSFALSAASVLGRDHAAMRRNAQDAYGAGVVPGGAWGIVCDGCGEGRRSEVGAGLAAALLAAELDALLRNGAPLDEVPQRATLRLTELLAEIACAASGGDERRRVAFVCEHLLTTVVGFCVRGDEGVAFWCGDGLVAIDDELVVIDEDNRPRYAAYGVLGSAAVEVAVRRFRAAGVRRLAIATDGFDPELVPAAFGRPGHALKRWMNVCSRAGHFRDDATIVTAEREATA